MIIIPAIDLKEGKCVRLEQGLMEKDTVFSDNPGAQARAWQEQGAELLHIVDLDGAFAGVPKNRAAIEAIVAAIDIPAELGGGIRDLATIEAYLAPRHRPRHPRHGGQAQPGPGRGGLPQISGTDRGRHRCEKRPGGGAGWAEVTGVDGHRAGQGDWKVSAWRRSSTPISARDGMMQGPNIEATRQLAEAIAIPVIASGGVSSLDDIEKLMAIEVVRRDRRHHRQGDLHRRHRLLRPEAIAHPDQKAGRQESC